MNTATIPKKIASQDDLVVIPRKEYEALLHLKKFKEFLPTNAQRKALLRAEQNFRQKKLFLTMDSSKNWDLRVDPSVFKTLKRIPRHDAEVLLEVIRLLPTGPYFGDIQKMKGEDSAWHRKNYSCISS